jgi:tetratricopeptide (TPR) repeat protein
MCFRFSHLLLCAALLTASLARAEEDDARALFDKGTAAFAIGHYGAAAAAYERAFEQRPDPALLYNAAQAWRLAGDKPRALQLYTNYVHIYATRITNRVEVERRIEELRSAIANERASLSSEPVAPRHDEAATPNDDGARRPAAAPVANRTALAARHAAADDLLATSPRPLRSKRTLVWGVVAGAVVVVGVAVGVGLAYGLPPRDPSVSLGRVQAN